MHDYAEAGAHQKWTFSIITITYNSERYLSETIASMRMQDYPDYEHIIVDGGSTDGTLDIIRNYAAADSRVRWISEPDHGISDAMNKGVAIANGEFIAHLHSDDYYPDSNVLSAVAKRIINNPDSVWLTGGAFLVGSGGQLLQEIHVRNFSYRKLVRGNFILHPATFVRRTVFLSLGGFSKKLKYAMDYEFWLRLAKSSAPVPIDLPLVCFRVHQSGVSSGESDKAFAEEFLIRREFLAGKPLRLSAHYLYYLIKIIRHKIVAGMLLNKAESDG
ncbi:MAG: glycosyltransferase family 2 protein [Desulfuromonadaceae bacterium]|nr:glycosyltransferase family 2 protein [Desulfuromonadaceae bacterium]MDD2854923.1 glycosyltransferase family 2 protein [Desulfuromonadaceae bacterium]